MLRIHCELALEGKKKTLMRHLNKEIKGNPRGERFNK